MNCRTHRSGKIRDCIRLASGGKYWQLLDEELILFESGSCLLILKLLFQKSENLQSQTYLDRGYQNKKAYYIFIPFFQYFQQSNLCIASALDLLTAATERAKEEDYEVFKCRRHRQLYRPFLCFDVKADVFTILDERLENTRTTGGNKATKVSSRLLCSQPEQQFSLFINK